MTYWAIGGSRFSHSLGDRLMVGQVPLTHFVQVRILVAQPKSRRQRYDRREHGRLTEVSYLGFFGGSNLSQKLDGFQSSRN